MSGMANYLGGDFSSFEVEYKDPATGAIKQAYPEWDIFKQAGGNVATIRLTNAYNPDPCGLTLLEGAQAKGIYCLPYVWTRLVPNTLIAQLKAPFGFIQTWKNLAQPALQPVLDLENYGSWLGWPGMDTEVGKACAELENTTQKPTWLYFSSGFVQSYFTASSVVRLFGFTGRKVIIAHWGAAAPLVPLPVTPLDIVAWQFTDRAFAPHYGVRNGNAGIALYEVYADRITGL